MKVIKRLHNSKGIALYYIIYHLGFPRLLTHGYLEDKSMNYMIITKFDADLEYMFTQHKREFSLQTIITIGVLMLDNLEKFHSLGYIHNDMKP
jgi:serine/threonine protein kinase